MLVFQPMPLGRKPRLFDDPAYLFELKYDGFRALAVVASAPAENILLDAGYSAPAHLSIGT